MGTAHRRLVIAVTRRAALVLGLLVLSLLILGLAVLFRLSLGLAVQPLADWGSAVITRRVRIGAREDAAVGLAARPLLLFRRVSLGTGDRRQPAAAEPTPAGYLHLGLLS